MVSLIFTTVAIMLVYMLIGLILCKVKLATVSHAKSLSAILIYVLGPAMIINSFIELDFTYENLTLLGQYFIVSLVLQALFFGILYAIFSRKFENSQYRIMSIGAVLGNVGFIGMPLMASVFPGNAIAICYCSINVMSMNLIVFTIGVFMITNDKKYMSVKNAIVNPTSIAIFVSVPIFVFSMHFPEQVESAFSNLTRAVTPVCMFILGMRLSEAKPREIFTRGVAYLTCFLKLCAFPIVAFLFVKVLPFGDEVLKTTLVVLAMAPTGAIIQSLAELHECEQDFAANVVLLTTLLSVISIPIMVAILV